MSNELRTGGCLCGAVRYKTTGEPTLLCCCHCESCRKATGAPMVPWGTYRTTQFDVTRGRLAEYRSSPPVVRGYCADCGTPLTYRHMSREGEIDVTLSSFDESAALAPTVHIWVRHKLPWVVLADGLPQFDETMDNP